MLTNNDYFIMLKKLKKLFSNKALYLREGLNCWEIVAVINTREACFTARANFNDDFNKTLRAAINFFLEDSQSSTDEDFEIIRKLEEKNKT